MNDRQRVSAVIVTYESESEIAACLDSLNRTASGWIRQIIVVDNASSDGTLKVLVSHSTHPEVLSNPENVGFGRAMNQGATAATGEYLLLLNPDCQVQDGGVAELVKFLDHRQSAGACGPAIVGPNGMFQFVSRRGYPTPLNSGSYLSSLDRLLPRHRGIGGYQLRWADPETEMQADALSGACMLVRRDTFAGVGGFDEEYFLFGEDIDLCWKIRETGREIWYVPAAKAEHLKGASMRRAPRRAQHEFYQSMRIFARKRLSARYSPITMALTRVGINVAEMWARARTRAFGQGK